MKLLICGPEYFDPGNPYFFVNILKTIQSLPFIWEFADHAEKLFVTELLFNNHTNYLDLPFDLIGFGVWRPILCFKNKG
jgi:hypothetical protein